MGSITDFVRKETPHLTPLIVDGAIAVLTPTLVFFLAGAKDLVLKHDDALSSWFLLLGESGVVALTALGGFRSKAYQQWKDYREQVNKISG